MEHYEYLFGYGFYGGLLNLSLFILMSCVIVPARNRMASWLLILGVGLNVLFSVWFTLFALGVDIPWHFRPYLPLIAGTFLGFRICHLQKGAATFFAVLLAAALLAFGCMDFLIAIGWQVKL